MEIQSGGAAEMRRLHIVYFLSRKGRIEHPHLVRVQHLSRNGVRLRDIKRWLGELRGKDMPHSFSWSYKRKYKTGYLWQDLMDEDLVTPISDNEYVLKGSEISMSSSNSNMVVANNKGGGLSFSEKKVVAQKDEESIEAAEAKDYKNNSSSKEEETQIHSSSSEASSIYISPKSSSEEILEEEESPTAFGSETSTLTDDTLKLERENEKQQAKEKIDNSSLPFYSTLLLNKKNIKSWRKSNKVVKILDENISTTPPAGSASSNTSSEPNNNLTKSKNNKLRHLITCGAVETNDSGLVMINKQNHKPFLKMCSSDEKNVHSAAEICKRDSNKLGSSQRILGNPKWTQQQWNGRKSIDGLTDSSKNKSEIREQRLPCKPINGPTCSQCGKQFKPDKLTSHMKSCKGMTKAAMMSSRAATAANPTAISAVSTATAETISTISRRRSTGQPRGDENSLSGYLLAH